MNVISFLSTKGGVGKTTLVSNLAIELAVMGKKVLVIDLDPQANLSLGFLGINRYVEEVENKKTLLNFFEKGNAFSFDRNEQTEIGEFIIDPRSINKDINNFSTFSKIDLIISNLNMISISSKLHSALKLSRSLSKIKHRYDVIIIDCPPSLDFFTTSAILASDYYVIPSVPDHFSTLGVPMTNNYVEKICVEYDKKQPIFLGVLFNKLKLYGGEPTKKDQFYINEIRRMDVPVFNHFFPSNSNSIVDLYDTGIPLFLEFPTFTYKSKKSPISELAHELIGKMECS